MIHQAGLLTAISLKPIESISEDGESVTVSYDDLSDSQIGERSDAERQRKRRLQRSLAISNPQSSLSDAQSSVLNSSQSAVLSGTTESPSSWQPRNVLDEWSQYRAAIDSDPKPKTESDGSSTASDEQEHLLIVSSANNLSAVRISVNDQSQASGTPSYFPQGQPQQTRPRINIPGMRNAYGEAGSQPSVAQLPQAIRNTGSNSKMTPRQQSMSDSLTNENFYDASAVPSQLGANDAMKSYTANDDIADVVRGLAQLLHAAGQLPIAISGVVAASGAKGGQHRALSLAENEKTKRTTKTFVEVRVVFLKIGEIDTLKEQYSADVYVQSRWREPLLDHKSNEELKTIDLTKFWSPCLYIENALSEQKDSSWQSASCNDRGEAFIAERRKMRGVFLENLELQNFPLDVQDLSITVVSERPDSDVELIPDEEDPSSVNIGTFADEQEWKLHQHVEVSKKTVKVEFANQQRQHSAIQVTCRAARRPGYFYYNVFLVMFFISSIAFGTFSVDCNLPQNRLQLSFTLLLTSIAFKMVINQSLPKISYLTYMDKYVLMSLVFLVLICVWHSIVPSIAGDKDGFFYVYKLENYVILGFFVIYIAGHILFAAFVYIHAWRRRLLMSQKDREFRMRSDFYGAASKSDQHLQSAKTRASPAESHQTISMGDRVSATSATSVAVTPAAMHRSKVGTSGGGHAIGQITMHRPT